jgi:hypothetical protein
LLLANDAFAFLHERHGHRVRDAVGGGLVGVQDTVEQLEIGLVLLEQRASQHVAQQEHDPDDLVGLHAAGDDPFGEVAGVGLQRLHAAGLEHLDVVVVDRSGLGEQFLRAHRGQQLGFGDAPCPLLAQRGPVLAQMLYQLRQQALCGGLCEAGA